MSNKLYALLSDAIYAFFAAFFGVVVGFGSSVLDQPAAAWRGALASGLAAAAVVVARWCDASDRRYGVGS